MAKNILITTLSQPKLANDLAYEVFELLYRPTVGNQRTFKFIDKT